MHRNGAMRQTVVLIAALVRCTRLGRNGLGGIRPGDARTRYAMRAALDPS